MRIVIKEEEWGPSYLLNHDTGKKCCMGFACLALGKTENQIEGRHMPKAVGINDFDAFASNELNEKMNMYRLSCSAPSTQSAPVSGASLSYIAAVANDRYHVTRNPEMKNKLVAIMRQVFREAGHTFVLRRAK